MSGSGHWERHADQWAVWARKPEFDSYWTESGPSFLALVPPPGRRTIDIGCGEGRVARDLKARGHDVVAVDAAPTLLRLAQEADPDGEYVLADAANLPFGAGAFDVAVAFNSLMDIDDMPGAIAEAGRVLAPRGRFCICITHPMRDAGRFEPGSRSAPFVIRGSYFGKRRLEDRVTREGLEMHFRSWAYAFEDYACALAAAGFVIEALREPPDPGRRVPNFLLIRAAQASR